MKKHNLLVILTLALFVTLSSVFYLGYSLWSIGGPYNVDPDGCGYRYVHYPGHGDRRVPACMDDTILVPIAKFLALGGPLTSIIVIVLLVWPRSSDKKSNDTVVSD